MTLNSPIDEEVCGVLCSHWSARRVVLISHGGNVNGPRICHGRLMSPADHWGSIMRCLPGVDPTPWRCTAIPFLSILQYTRSITRYSRRLFSFPSPGSPSRLCFGWLGVFEMTIWRIFTPLSEMVGSDSILV